MAHSVTRSIDKVERAIPEEVKGTEVASFDAFGEINLSQISSTLRRINITSSSGFGF